MSREADEGIMSDKDEDADRMRISQVLAGALAAVTAALIGSTMGVAGTIAGAGVASVVSTVGGALYLRSIERTSNSVRTVRAKVVGRSGGSTVLVADPGTAPPVAGEEVEATPDEEPGDRPQGERGKRRWPMLVVGSLAVFALGMLAVTGIEWLRGEPLSGGTGTTFGSVVLPHRDDDTQRQEQPADPATSTTAPTAPAPGSAPPGPTTTGPATTTTTPPSEPSTTTTTTPPVTTTTEVEAPGGSAIPPN
ncbi:hypothetical protein [Actinophytocola glycyrrhizae]|uniref:Uncharacterized protein n=1 Tax=Actinophytocola glycyrrhizae TaxID=2044873 RepID=A0ABV9S089_9PSEU